MQQDRFLSNCMQVAASNEMQGWGAVWEGRGDRYWWQLPNFQARTNRQYLRPPLAGHRGGMPLPQNLHGLTEGAETRSDLDSERLRETVRDGETSRRAADDETRDPVHHLEPPLPK